MKKKLKRTVAKPRRTIVAEEIELVDNEGRTRALFSTHARTGLPFLGFLDEQGRYRVTIGMDLGNRATFSMLRENGRTFLGCGDDGDGRVGLALYDESGSPGLVLTIHPDGERCVQVYDTDRNLIWQATCPATKERHAPGKRQK